MQLVTQVKNGPEESQIETLGDDRRNSKTAELFDDFIQTSYSKLYTILRNILVGASIRKLRIGRVRTYRLEVL